MAMIRDIPVGPIGWSVLDVDYSPDQRFFIACGWSAYGSYKPMWCLDIIDTTSL